MTGGGSASRTATPGRSSSTARSAAFNKRFAATTPCGVVSVASVADVGQAIVWARDAGVDVVARGGGHSYAGYSVNTGLVVDLSALNTVTADRSTGLVTAAGG